SSWAKTALAAFKISLTRRSSAFSRRSRRNSSSSAVESRSRRRPRSASSWRIQLRNASGCTPNCSASRRITGFGSDSRYKRTARARNASGYFLGAATKTPFLVHQTMIKSLRKTGGSSTTLIGQDYTSVVDDLNVAAGGANPLFLFSGGTWAVASVELSWEY